MADALEYFWSREVGKFVDKTTGKAMTGASFVLLEEQYEGELDRLWCETMIEVVIDLGNVLSAWTDLTKIRLVSSPKAAGIMARSVLHGRRSTNGLLLQCEPIEYTSDANEIVYVDEAGEALAVLTILDVP